MDAVFCISLQRFVYTNFLSVFEDTASKCKRITSHLSEHTYMQVKSLLNCFSLLMLLIFLIGFAACKSKAPAPPEEVIVEKPELLDDRIAGNLKKTLAFALENKGRVNDTILLRRDSLVSEVYKLNNHKPYWSRSGKWVALADSTFYFIEHCKEYGLFPSDYHYRSLNGIKNTLLTDTLAQRDAALWSRADLMLTDAVLLIGKHLKQGHFTSDSISLRKDSLFNNEFYVKTFTELFKSQNLRVTLQNLEPRSPKYDSLKAAAKSFLDSAQFKRFTYLKYPYKDSLQFYGLLQKRLFELDVLPSPSDVLDTTAFKKAISTYQKEKGLRVTGRINETTVNSMNNTDWEKFKRIAINLDRYKMFGDTMPETYVWVNIPAYTMQVISGDSVALQSRVIVGLPKTRTPLLNSEITNFITYPQWTVPYSIVFKEMLPQIQKNIGYLAKQNLMVVDKNDSILDPWKIDWSKLSKKNFPYQLKQREGDNNSLGVLKFNFRNKYSVYLHDTNARWLFSKSSRALSHGCVRVQKWDSLANFLVRYNTDRYPPDTLKNWISRQEKHVVHGFPRVPIYIRYFTTDVRDGKLKFYDDIYGEDKMLRERYFSDKSIN